MGISLEVDFIFYLCQDLTAVVDMSMVLSAPVMDFTNSVLFNGVCRVILRQSRTAGVTIEHRIRRGIVYVRILHDESLVRNPPNLDLPHCVQRVHSSVLIPDRFLGNPTIVSVGSVTVQCEKEVTLPRVRTNSRSYEGLGYTNDNVLKVLRCPEEIMLTPQSVRLLALVPLLISWH